MLIQSYIKCIPQLILCPMISFYRFLLLVFTFLFPGFNLFDVAVFLIFKFYLDCLLDFQYLTLFRLSTSILASNLILISIKIMPNKSDAVLVPTGRYVIVSRTGISEKNSSMHHRDKTSFYFRQWVRIFLHKFDNNLFSWNGSPGMFKISVS